MPAPSKSSLYFLAAGFYTLLLAAYLDNMRGPLMPAIAQDVGLSHTAMGQSLAVSYLIGAAATMGLLFALNRWSERAVILAAAAAGSGLSFVASQAQDFPMVLVLGALTGATSAVLGTMSNVLVLEGAPPAWRSRALAGLHAMFGLGSMLGATMVGRTAAAGRHWSDVFDSILPALAILAVFAVGALRRDIRIKPPTRQSARLRAPHLIFLALIGSYVVGEVMTSMWLPTYLVSVAGFDLPSAASMQARYFLTLTLSRLACVLIATPRTERVILIASLCAPLLAFAWGRLVDPRAFVGIGLFGPFFPVMLARASRSFPDSWRSLTIWTIVGNNTLLAIFSAGVGALALAVGIAKAFYLPPFILALGLSLLLAYFRWWEPRDGAERGERSATGAGAKD